MTKKYDFIYGAWVVNCSDVEGPNVYRVGGIDRWKERDQGLLQFLGKDEEKSESPNG